MIVSAVVLALLLGMAATSRLVIRPLLEMKGAAEKIASGDLTHTLPIRGRSEISLLGEADQHHGRQPQADVPQDPRGHREPFADHRRDRLLLAAGHDRRRRPENRDRDDRRRRRGAERLEHGHGRERPSALAVRGERLGRDHADAAGDQQRGRKLGRAGIVDRGDRLVGAPDDHEHQGDFARGSSSFPPRRRESPPRSRRSRPRPGRSSTTPASRSASRSRCWPTPRAGGPPRPSTP